jgi:hypothetical protein
MAAEELTEGQVQHPLRLFIGRVLCESYDAPGRTP